MTQDSTNPRLVQLYTKAEAADDSRRQLLSTFNGVLSTIMRDIHNIDGYPFASVLPFCLNYEGEIILLMSDIAQHTRNIKQNSKVSFIIHNYNQENIQKGWRLTVIGNIEPIESEDYLAVSQRYTRFYPESTHYHKIHDFHFYRLIPEKYRYINGFGEIHWVDRENLLAPSPFNAECEQSMLHHMNSEHFDTLLRLIKQRAPLKQLPIRMTHIDQYGFTITMGETIFRYFFEREATTPDDIRKNLIRMAKEVA